jgi:hypothetical protein
LLAVARSSTSIRLDNMAATVAPTAAATAETKADMDREIKALAQRVVRTFHASMEAVLIDQLVRQEPA